MQEEPAKEEFQIKKSDTDYVFIME